LRKRQLKADLKEEVKLDKVMNLYLDNLKHIKEQTTLVQAQNLLDEKKEICLEQAAQK
jgi:hypothetical protein